MRWGGAGRWLAWRRRAQRSASAAPWDMAMLLAAAASSTRRPQRHLWLIRLLEWLRAQPSHAAGAAHALPRPQDRLRHFLDTLDEQPAAREAVHTLLQRTLVDVDATGLLADYGFARRNAFFAEFTERLRSACLPHSPQTSDMGELFALVFRDDDAQWIAELDDALLARLVALVCGEAAPNAPPDTTPPDTAPTATPLAPWAGAMVEAIQLLASQMCAAGLSPLLRSRIDPRLMVDRPFHQVVHAAEALRNEHVDGHANPEADRRVLLQRAHYLRAVLAHCREAAASVRDHLEEWGISVDVVFLVDQLGARATRIETLLEAAISPEPVRALRELLVTLLRTGAQRRGLRALFRRHYAQLARKVTERSAAVGEHYITRDRAGWRSQFASAAGGGLVLGFTTLTKLFLGVLGLAAFWMGWWAGVVYAVSFVLIYLLHWTVATKQPAMTAPTLAAKLERVSVDDAALEGFVDEVAHLIRSQTAGILGNVLVVAPTVLAVQMLALVTLDTPLVAPATAQYIISGHHLLGMTLPYAMLTGVLLFASSLIAGWVENWFVFHRLDSAIAWNPRFVAAFGTVRTHAWARWWRRHISGLTVNVALGLLLGLVPAVAGFFALPVEVRHVTLVTGQIAAALGTLGTALLHEPAFWWAAATIPLTGLLNVAVSFALAFSVAISARQLQVRDRGRIYRALRQRLRRAPLSFFWPPASVKAPTP